MTAVAESSLMSGIPEAPTPEPRPRRTIHALWIVLALTLIGGTMRFSFLAKPAIWGDEAYTYARVNSSYKEMLDALVNWGFPPVHYELLWWIKEGMPLGAEIKGTPIKPVAPLWRAADRTLMPTHQLIKGGVVLRPEIIRLVPAICGTLMIPAMYWLAVQLVNRRAALLVTALTAFSAYMLNYSRDGKMYMPMWFFAALSFASLLWWLRKPSLVGWLLWIASSLAMVSFASLGWVVIAMEIIPVLTARKTVSWKFGQPFSFVLFLLALPMLAAMPLLMVRLLLKLPQFAAWIGAGALAFTWVISFGLGERGRYGRWLQGKFERFTWPAVVFFALGAAIPAAGSYGYYNYFNQYKNNVFNNSSSLLSRLSARFGNQSTLNMNMSETGLSWIQRYNEGRTGSDLVQYTATALAYNWEWPREIDMPKVAPRTLNWLKTAAITIACILALGALPWPRTWRGDGTSDGWFVQLVPIERWWRTTLLLAIWIVVPAYGFYCASLPKPMPPVDTGSFSLAGLRGGVAGAGGDWLHFVTALPRWKDAIAIVLAIGCFWMSGLTWKQRIVRSASFLAIACIVLLACQRIFVFFQTRHFPASVWMPRYLGVCWPAFIMIIAVLLSRLPTWPVRWIATAIFIGINLSVFSARVFAGSEPPTDKFTWDIFRTIDSTTERAYIRLNDTDYAPGGGAMYTGPSTYYLSMFSGTPIAYSLVEVSGILSPIERRFGRNAWREPVLNFPRLIANDVKGSPSLQRAIVWESFPTKRIDSSDRMLEQLKLADPNWTLAKEELFYVRDHWTWRDMNVERRRTYERPPAPATAPVAPTTIPASTTTP